MTTLIPPQKRGQPRGPQETYSFESVLNTDRPTCQPKNSCPNFFSLGETEVIEAAIEQIKDDLKKVKGDQLADMSSVSDARKYMRQAWEESQFPAFVEGKKLEAILQQAINSLNASKTTAGNSLSNFKGAPGERKLLQEDISLLDKDIAIATRLRAAIDKVISTEPKQSLQVDQRKKAKSVEALKTQRPVESDLDTQPIEAVLNAQRPTCLPSDDCSKCFSDKEQKEIRQSLEKIINQLASDTDNDLYQAISKDIASLGVSNNDVRCGNMFAASRGTILAVGESLVNYRLALSADPELYKTRVDELKKTVELLKTSIDDVQDSFKYFHASSSSRNNFRKYIASLSQSYDAAKKLLSGVEEVVSSATLFQK